SSEADSRSTSPSASRSAAATHHTPSAVSVTTCSVQVGAAPPLLSYQAILSSLNDADTTSMLPSPSTSATAANSTPSAVVVIVWLVNPGGCAPSLSSHRTRSS